VTLRQVVAPAGRYVARQAVRARTRTWPAYSRLFAVGERTDWSVDEDARHFESTARRLGYDVAPTSWARFADRQAVFLASHFEALRAHWLESTHRLVTAYLHGRPGTSGYPEFDLAYERLRAAPERFAGIQVTHEEMRNLVLEAGVDASRVHLIPIGIDLENFPLVDSSARKQARDALGVPESTFVVGSFQKDGVGWEEGLEPKLVKGPDVLIAALAHVKAAAPELFVVLTGPARGYVRRELERLAIPYRHVRANDRAELARAYYALDVYVVTSRQEGGPKAALESMATGVPLVTTRVGQAPTLVQHGRNGWLVDVGDAESIADWVMHVRAGGTHAVIEAGRETAERHALERFDAAWEELLQDVLERRAL
jgi:glycosyltransferase involved in cell wall biosynthesis